MVVSDAIHNIMGGMESTAGVRLHNHRRKLKQRFDIIKRLGQGTYGKVQLGINKETGQEVAIKTIKKSKIETDADLIRIRREIQIMSSVQHPNIIHIYEVFENREKMVLVMEYAAGGELYDYLSERKVLDETEARRIFRQISTAVYYCHKHKICHRDLKLENILLDEHGSAKIADFGLSNVFDEQRLLGTFCGSPLYASPEIVKGTPYHGPEVDCWSLGVLLYTLVYGAMPFDGSNFKRLVKQISQGDYFEPKKPSPASSLIRDMLNVNPACRANIEKICAHRWVNEAQAQSCVEIAEELANQTPVRLDLLLSLAPPPTSADALLVNKDQDATAAGPTRSQSVGSLMELDHPRSFDAEKRRLSETGQLPDTAASKESPPKRKLEQRPSSEEANQSGAKRKERSRHRDRDHSSERRQHRSSSRSKQSERQSTSKVESPKKGSSQEPSQIPSPEEVKAVENVVVDNQKENVPEQMEVDVVEVPQATDVEAVKNVEEIKVVEVSEEVTKTPGESVTKVEETTAEETKSNEEAKKVKVKRKKKTSDLKLSDTKDEAAKSEEIVPKKEAESEVKDSSQKEETSAKDEPIPKEAETSAGAVNGDKPTESAQVVKPEAPVEVKEKKVVRKIGSVKKKSDLSSSKIAQAADKPSASEESTPPTKPMVRRRSKIFESEIQKFNNMSAADIKTPVVEKPKKVFIPGVKVSDFKKAYERKSSVDLSSTTSVPNAVKAPVKKAVNSEETSDGDKSQRSEESSTSEVSKESLENKTKPVDVAPSTEKVLKPDDLSIKITPKSITPPENVSLTDNETSVSVATTKEPQEQICDKTETIQEVKPEPVVPSPEKPIAKDELAKKQKAVAIIGNAIAKPPKPTLDKLKLRNTSLKSPPDSPKKKSATDETPGAVSPSGKKLVKIQVGPNDVRNATLQVSTPEQIQNFNYNEANKTDAGGEESAAAPSVDDKERDRKKSSKVEIVLKSATLPRRKTSKAEIQLGAPKPVPEYRSEVEHMVGTRPGDSRLQNQRSEVAFPVAAAQGQPHSRSASVEPEGAVKPKAPKERIIPIQFERPVAVTSPPPSKPPVPPLSQQRSMSQGQRSSSLSRQSTLDSDTESVGTTMSGGAEPIRKSPREYIIPIAVEGGGYVTPRAGSLEPDSTSESTTASTQKPRSKPHRFPRTMRMGSLLSDGGLSEDEGFNSISSPFSTLNRHREQREGEAEEDKGLHHMHRLRSSRPSRRPTLEHADSLSSAEEEEDDDDDGFELLTAESLFSTLLSRVRNLTQRLNVDDNRTGFPSSRFMNHNFPSHSSFWGNMEPLSRRVSETSRPSRDESASSWRRSVSRDTDCDSQYSDATNSNAPSSLPRGSSRYDFDEMSDVSNPSYPSYYTPSLARRIQRTNQELRNRSDSSYSPLPPRDYTTLPSRRPMSRTSSLKSEDGTRRPAHFVPTRSPSCLDSSRNTDMSRSFHERSGSVERYMPQVGNDDGGYLRGNVTENGSIDRDSSASRRSTSYLGSKSSMGSCDSLNNIGKLGSKSSFGSSDSLNHVGKRDFSREHAKRISESDSSKSYLSPTRTRRNIASLDGGYGDSLPRRHPYRSSMSDMADYTRKRPNDYHRSHSRISEEVNNYDHETLPPLPQTSSYVSRKRDGGAQKSSSYLRQRAIDIANIYGAPLPAAEPTRLERDVGNGMDQPYNGYRSGTATPTNQDYSSLSKTSFEDRMAMKYGDGEQRGRSQIPKVSHFRSSSLSREDDSSRRETVREAIIRRQKSFDKLDQSQEKTEKPKLQRPLSLSLQPPSDNSVLSKFFNGDVGNHETNGIGTLSVEENKPTSPVRSPGRKVSRFLRPDFYDTPREESSFAKEKDEAAKVKEVEEQKQERESEQYYKDLGTKLTSKTQLPKTAVKPVDVEGIKPNSLTEQETRSETLPQKVMVNLSQSSDSNAKIGREEKCSTKDVQSVLSKSIETPNVSENLVPMEPKVAKVFKPKLAIKKDPVSSLLKAVEGSVNIPEINVSKDIQPKLINKDPVTNLSKSAESSIKIAEVNVSKDVDPKLINKVAVSTLPKSVEGSIKIPNVNVTKEVKPTLINKGPDITLPKLNDEIVKAPVSNNVDDVPSKTAIQTEPTFTKLKANNVAATTVVSKVVKGSDTLLEKVGSVAIQEAEPKLPKVAEGTGKVKVKKKIVKKTVGADSVKKTSESLGIKVKAAASAEIAGAALSTQSAKQTNAEIINNESKSDVYVEKDVKVSAGKSRIDQVIRCLRERSLTPKGSDDILTVSNLLKRAVSVDNCSSDSNVTKSTNKIKKVIKSLKELTTAPKTNHDTESSLLKRAVSVDDCSNPSQTKSNKVNSVLGMFRKMEEPKVDVKAEKKASLLSRFRKTQSLYAGSASDSVLVQDLEKVEVKEKTAISKGRKFGFRGSKTDKTSPSIEPETHIAVSNGANPGPAKTAQNGIPNMVAADSDSNVSCSVKIKLPDKDILKHSKQNGTLIGNDEDVSVSTTIKIVKDVTKENGTKCNKPNDAETFTIKKATNIPKVFAENGVKSDICNKDAFSKPRNNSKIPQMTTNNGPTCNDDKTIGVGGSVSPRIDNTAGKSKDFDPISSSSMPSEEDMESFDDSCSVCSDWEFRTSPLPAYQHRPAEPEGSETMQERIRRKSFFSRFNDAKKIPAAARRTSTSAIPSLREPTMTSPTNRTRRENRPDEI